MLITGGFMLCYVIFGGMLATTWVQIIKAVLLMTATIVLSLFVLGKIGWNPIDIFDRAAAQSDDGGAYLAPGLNFTNPIDTISLGIALLLGTAGLPHILMRFFTVPNAKAARSSVVWAVGLIGAFYVMTTFLGFGSRALLGEAGTTGAVDEAGNLAAPLLAQSVGGGAGSVGGDAFLAIIAAVAFATILAVVAGLVISASGAVAHDVWSNVIRKGRDSEKEEVHVARIAAFAIGAIAIAIAIMAAPTSMSPTWSASRSRSPQRQLPGAAAGVDVETVQHDRRGHRRAARQVSSVGLVLLGPDVRTSDPLIELTQPAIISVPLGFLGCILGSLLSRDETRPSVSSTSSTSARRPGSAPSAARAAGGGANATAADASPRAGGRDDGAPTPTRTIRTIGPRAFALARGPTFRRCEEG